MVLDSEQWVSTNFGACELGDARRTKRLFKVAGNMLAAPEQSIVQQNQHWADVKAAYRFFDNDCVTFENVAQVHWRQTRQTKSGRYLLIGDMTDIDHYSHEATTGLGMLGDGKGRGMQLHNCLMYDCNAKLIRGAAGDRSFRCSRSLSSPQFQLKLIGRSQPNAKASTHVPASWLKAWKLARPKVHLTGVRSA